MTDLRTAAQQALEALDGLSEDAVCQSSHHAKKDRHTSLDVCPVFLRLRAAITTLRAALAEPVQEPVAWYFEARHIDSAWAAAVTLKYPGPGGKYVRKVTRLYATPQRRPLTEDEIRQVGASYTEETWIDEGWSIAFARAIEHAHGIV